MGSTYKCFEVFAIVPDVNVFSPPPLAPADQELRNVIDKLAQFVARNGPEFEKMTMEKQKDNPKFSFLFGGDFYGYYKYKLALEQQQCESGGRNYILFLMVPIMRCKAGYVNIVKLSESFKGGDLTLVREWES